MASTEVHPGGFDKRNNKGVARIFRAARYSFTGFIAAIRCEAAFRQELALFVVMAPVALWLGHSGTERALMIGSLFLILIVELLNSAVESVVDRVGTERHSLSGQAKDMGSAAVALALINAALVWALILWGHRV